MTKGRLKGYMKRLFHITSQKFFLLRILGEINNHQIWLLRTRENTEHQDPKLLICSGFHGEEKAGPLAILKWLEECRDSILEKVDLSFIPIVNPTGFNRGIRYNSWGEKTNCGFCYDSKNRDKPSKEGQILINNIELLKNLAKDGFLSLHEDIISREFYIYGFSKSGKPNSLIYKIRDKEMEFFKPISNNVKINEEGDTETYAKDGIVMNLHDGSFEDWLFHLGVPVSIVTETPGKARISKRIECGVALINEFIELAKRRKDGGKNL